MLLLSSLLLVAYTSTKAQGVCDVPTEYVVERYREYIPLNINLMPSRLFLIGWNKTYLVYGVEPPDEACGCYFFKLHVLDLATQKDTVLYNYNGGIEAEHEDQFSNIKEFWKANESLLCSQLKQYKITQPIHKIRTTEPVPYKVATTIDTNHIAETIVPVIERIQVTDPATQKIVYEHRYENVYKRPMEIEVVEVFALAGLNKQFLLLAEKLRGWEGPPHIIFYKLVPFD